MDDMLTKLYELCFNEKRASEAIRPDSVSEETWDRQRMVAIAKLNLLEILIEFRTKQLRSGRE